MKVLVTGGTGYLGQAVVRALAARGHIPVVFARSAGGHTLPGVAAAGDIRDRAALDRAAEGCEAICHLAALVSVWRSRAGEFDEVNVGGLRNVLAVADARRLAPIVYTSSFLARPPAGSPDALRSNDYQRTKLDAERVAADAAAAGAPIVRLYPGVLYGPGTLTEGNLVGRLIADHLAGRLPGIIGADRLWSYAYVDDVAAAYVAVLERGITAGQFALGGENLPQMRTFEILRDETGTRLPRRIPYAVADALGIAEEARARLFGATPRLTRRTVEIFRHDWPLDSTAAGRALGYTITPLREGLVRTIAALTRSAAARAERSENPSAL